MPDTAALLQHALDTGQLDGLKFNRSGNRWQVSVPSPYGRGAWSVGIDPDPFVALAKALDTPKQDDLDFMQ